jgi:hypothetical protein
MTTPASQEHVLIGTKTKWQAQQINVIFSQILNVSNDEAL